MSFDVSFDVNFDCELIWTSTSGMQDKCLLSIPLNFEMNF